MRLHRARRRALRQQQGASVHTPGACGASSAAGRHLHAFRREPYAGVSTAVLIFTKTAAGGTDNVWFYDMQADGFSLDDKRAPVDQNDIPDILARFADLEKEKDRARTEQSFFVPKEEIVANGYDLSINKYKQVEYAPVEYPSTQELMTELHELEMQISEGLAELEEML